LHLKSYFPLVFVRSSLVLLLFCVSFMAQAGVLPALLPSAFEYNAGQTGPDVTFISRSPAGGTAISLTRAGIRLGTPQGPVSLKFIGANPDTEIAGLDIQQARSNYFRGNDPSRWRTGVPNYARVQYREIYPGVNLIFYRTPSGPEKDELEYDLVLKPGADPRSIRLGLSGTGAVRLDSAGDLLFGGVRLRRPSVYQEINGRRKWIAAGFRRIDSHQVAFRIAPWDRRRSLVIDPVLTWSTHLGGGSPGDTTGVYGIAADSAGNAYVTGLTAAQDFPTRNPEQPFYGGDNGDAFVAKISADGSTLLYSTYLGGSNTDQGNAIAIDSAGNAYVTGVTESSNFPTVTPFQTFQHSPNASGGTGFVAEIGADGSELLYSSWLGGSGAENAAPSRSMRWAPPMSPESLTPAIFRRKTPSRRNLTPPMDPATPL
jgi:hypothetical protein